ncbi:unnamed protein product [Paramecium pentaurelia]|uniref:Uncharacterized protein n=1 Tax=Paramecium pentaurelia TaxID=43138 RepID=A0A8S1UJI2_9CILI|nr:unnamed protein product [Paramecium pentaurelia]
MNNNEFLVKQFEVLKKDATIAMQQLAKDYNNVQLVNLAIELNSLLRKYEVENNKLRNEIDQQQQKTTSDTRIQELQQNLDDANNRYYNLFEQYQKSQKENEKIENQRKKLEKQTNEYIVTLKQQINDRQSRLFQIYKEDLSQYVDKDPLFPQNKQYQKEFEYFKKSFKEVSVQCSFTIKEIEKSIKQAKEEQVGNDEIFTQNLQSYQNVLTKNMEAKQVLEMLIKKFADFRQQSNITDDETNNILDQNGRILQIQNVIMNKLHDIFKTMYENLVCLEKKNKKLQHDNNELNEKIKKQAQIDKQEIGNQQPIIQSIKQSSNLNNMGQSQKNQIFVKFNELRNLLKFSNDEFHQILLQFVSQGLTIADFKLKQEGQKQIVQMVNNLKSSIQDKKSISFQELINEFLKFQQFFNYLKQQINEKNNLIDVFNIQDKFFKNYEKTINHFVEIEKIYNLIDLGIQR